LTENKKFETFLSDILNAQIELSQQKREIVKYVRVVETFYTDQIAKLKTSFNSKVERLQRQIRQQAVKNYRRGEMEDLFVSALEEVKKDVLKRRMKQEIFASKSEAKGLTEAQEFEQSLLKVVNLAKDKIKITEFNKRDKLNLLELLVSNDRVLQSIYKSLFPKHSTFEANASRTEVVPDVEKKDSLVY